MSNGVEVMGYFEIVVMRPRDRCPKLPHFPQKVADRLYMGEVHIWSLRRTSNSLCAVCVHN